MTIYEITSDAIRPFAETSFYAAGVRERSDLQRLLRNQVDVISPDTLVIAEEFSEWEDSQRRVDLLGLDSDGNLVVIELKRTEDGGHMELQAIRYAAMVSAMTFEKAVEVYANYLSRTGSTIDARTKILEFLEWEEPDEDNFAQDVRIVLVSAEFSKELTTAVMWLNEHELDIRCIRMKPYMDNGRVLVRDLPPAALDAMKPYMDNGRVLVDVQQVIPLPEAADYIVKIKEKEERERTARREQSEGGKMLMRFWSGLLAKAKDKTDLHAGISPCPVYWIGTGAGISGLTFDYALSRKLNRVELYIGTNNKEENKRIFDQLFAAKGEIERRFAGPLGWQRLDDKIACRIKAETEKTMGDESDWPILQDALIDLMIRFEKALRPALDEIRR